MVCQSQQGSSVELSLVLTSVLLGAGYRAFVVQGAASPTLVTRDTSNLTCPYLPKLREVCVMYVYVHQKNNPFTPSFICPLIKSFSSLSLSSFLHSFLPSLIHSLTHSSGFNNNNNNESDNLHYILYTGGSERARNSSFKVQCPTTT